MSVNAAVTATPGRVDVRATRFVATVTATVLAVVLILAGFSVRAAAVLLSVQALVFAVGAVWGPARHPYGVMFRRLIAPRRGPATKLEAVEQIRFAQLMGFTFCAVGIAGFVASAVLVLLMIISNRRYRGG